MIDRNTILNGDCLELMQGIADKSVDMILCDLPYGTTDCKWDTIIPFELLWKQYKRIIKDNGAIVLTASQPFTSALVMSNIKMFRYEWIWEKDRAGNFGCAQHQPLRYSETVNVFYKKKGTYNPQMVKAKRISNAGGKGSKTKRGATFYSSYEKTDRNSLDRYPSNIIKFDTPKHNDTYGMFQPTQKPVALFEYLIKTYTNEGELVLDNCGGSMTTAIACINTNRDYILMEKDAEYYNKGVERVSHHLGKKNEPTLFNQCVGQ